jgi:hypothetical protein
MPRVWAKVESIARERGFRIYHLFNDEDVENFLKEIETEFERQISD